MPSVGTLAQKQLTAGELSLTVVRLCKGDIEQGTFTCWLLIQIRVQALYPTPLNGHQPLFFSLLNNLIMDRLVPEALGSKNFEKFDFRPCAGLHFFEFIVNKSARSRQF